MMMIWRCETSLMKVIGPFRARSHHHISECWNIVVTSLMLIQWLTLNASASLTHYLPRSSMSSDTFRIRLPCDLSSKSSTYRKFIFVHKFTFSSQKCMPRSFVSHIVRDKGKEVKVREQKSTKRGWSAFELFVLSILGSTECIPIAKVCLSHAWLCKKFRTDRDPVWRKDYEPNCIGWGSRSPTAIRCVLHHINLT